MNFKIQVIVGIMFLVSFQGANSVYLWEWRKNPETGEIENVRTLPSRVLPRRPASGGSVTPRQPSARPASATPRPRVTSELDYFESPLSPSELSTIVAEMMQAYVHGVPIPFNRRAVEWDRYRFDFRFRDDVRIAFLLAQADFIVSRSSLLYSSGVPVASALRNPTTPRSPKKNVTFTESAGLPR